MWRHPSTRSAGLLSAVRFRGLKPTLRNMSLPLVIINPESASGATRDAWPGIASELATHFGAFQPRFTRAPGEASEIAAEAAQKDRLIIACGGDGTITEVANGILMSGGDC